MNRFTCAGFAVAALILLVAALFTPQHVTRSHSSTAVPPAPQVPRQLVAPPSVTPGDSETEPDDPDGTVDLYGNDVSPALATYSFDALGGPYEVHSPQTELPRLGSSKT